MTQDNQTTARAIHARYPVIDGHSDRPTDLARRREAGATGVFGAVHREPLCQGGVAAELAALYFDTPERGPAVTVAALNALDALHQEVAEQPDALTIAGSAADIEAAFAAGRYAMLPGLEGGSPLNGQLGLLRIFHRLGLRWLGFTWNYRNELADGCSEAATGGLSRFGLDVVKACNDLGILLDISHLAEAGVAQLLAAASGPVIASHANARALTPHVRNLTDRHLDAIARSGGTVGVVFFAQFVHPDPNTATTDHLLDHVDYLKQRIGIDHIAVGPDFTDYMMDRYTARQNLGAAGIYHPAFHCAAGLDTAAEFHNLTVGLLSRGYTEAEIAAILGGNLLRVLKAVVG